MAYLLLGYWPQPEAAVLPHKALLQQRLQERTLQAGLDAWSAHPAGCQGPQEGQCRCPVLNWGANRGEVQHDVR